MTSAIIVAGGSSRRMGFDKLFAKLDGKPVIAHSIASFHQCRKVQEIVLVVREDRIAEFEKLVRSEGFKKVKHVVAGGAQRHLSVWNGLQKVSSKADFVAIHDGARPLTTAKLISQCLALAQEHGAACCASQVPDTVKRASEMCVITESVDRTGLWAMQTPQIFSSGLIMQAYAGLITNQECVTDEVSAIQRLGKKIALLRNDDWNFKITFPRDLDLARDVLARRRRKKHRK
jgi:2-C-methyl-D-erythritol 4-phosphate cytidylyltransferase